MFQLLHDPFLFARVDKQECPTLALVPSGTTNAMHVSIHILRYINLNNPVHGREIDTPRNDVGSEQT